MRSLNVLQNVLLLLLCLFVKMATSLRNVSTLLSPKFVSPLSPSRNLVNLPGSDGKMYLRKTNRNIARKLDFTPESPKPNVPNVKIQFTNRKLDFTRGKPNFPAPQTAISPIFRPKVPNIKIDLTEDEKFEECTCGISNLRVLDMNTPIKVDLARNGLANFKKRTTVLGQGTFGIVFQGKHKGETVAVKLVTKETCSRERNALGLNHVNIVRTIEIITNSEHQNYSLIIMEYLPNCKTLQQTLDSFDIQGNTGDVFKVVASQITSGLQYLHSRNVIHLDLKPKNILVAYGNVCKICDFGNSIKAGEVSDDFTHNGTVMYTAPEILLGKRPTVKSDIYSLGLVLWQIWHRENPFQEYETRESIIYNIGKHNVRPPFREDTPESLKTLLDKCWGCNPEARPEVDEVLLELAEVQLEPNISLFV